MKKVLILIACVSMFAGCASTTALFTNKPDDLPRFVFIEQDSRVLMVERATGSAVVVTATERKRMNKLKEASNKVFADRIYSEREKLQVIQ